ncbi:hypothetical protein ACT7DB_01055 [Bacillus cereus]
MAGATRDLDINVKNGEHADKRKWFFLILHQDVPEEVMKPGCVRTGVNRTKHLCVNRQSIRLLGACVSFYNTFPKRAGRVCIQRSPIQGKNHSSAAVPVGTMFSGIASDYFMGGLSRAQRFNRMTKHDAIEDEQYIAHLYANGRAKENESFLYMTSQKMEQPPADDTEGSRNRKVNIDEVIGPLGESTKNGNKEELSPIHGKSSQ